MLKYFFVILLKKKLKMVYIKNFLEVKKMSRKVIFIALMGLTLLLAFTVVSGHAAALGTGIAID